MAQRHTATELKIEKKSIEELFNERLSKELGKSFEEVRAEFRAIWARTPPGPEAGKVIDAIVALERRLLGDFRAVPAANIADSKKSERQRALDEFRAEAHDSVRFRQSCELYEALMPEMAYPSASGASINCGGKRGLELKNKRRTYISTRLA